MYTDTKIWRRFQVLRFLNFSLGLLKNDMKPFAIGDLGSSKSYVNGIINLKNCGI